MRGKRKKYRKEVDRNGKKKKGSKEEIKKEIKKDKEINFKRVTKKSKNSENKIKRIDWDYVV